VEPTAELLPLPPDYGASKRPLAWDEIRARLEEAPNYWLTTVRADGRPHVVPLDGIWLDSSWYFGGSPSTVHMRNAARGCAGVLHIGEGLQPIIVEGPVSALSFERDTAERLAAVNNVKYSHYGMTATAETYRKGYCVLRAERVMAWNTFPEDATRFVFVE
jgi:predicted pyridoxine 5'-phosphate oxidase superfamily flavin-nucleotide-binding protein